MSHEEPEDISDIDMIANVGGSTNTQLKCPGCGREMNLHLSQTALVLDTAYVEPALGEE